MDEAIPRIGSQAASGNKEWVFQFRSDGDVIIAGLMIGACQYEMPGNVQPTVFPRP